MASAEQGNPAAAADKTVRFIDYHGKTVCRASVLYWEAILSNIRKPERHSEENGQQFFPCPKLGRLLSWKPFNGCGYRGTAFRHQGVRFHL